MIDFSVRHFIYIMAGASDIGDLHQTQTKIRITMRILIRLHRHVPYAPGMSDGIGFFGTRVGKVGSEASREKI